MSFIILNLYMMRGIKTMTLFVLEVLHVIPDIRTEC